MKETAKRNGLKEQLATILGSHDSIFDRPEIVDMYSKDFSLTPQRKPRLVVKARNVDDVQAIIKWANQARTPLVPVSSGPPRFYGDTVPSVTDAVIVDLSEMNKIIRIDRKNRMVLIEPGVTYSQLQPELAKEGLKLSTPLLPRANKSVIASLLERQPTLVPKYNWSLPEPLRCLEVTWGNGETMWTGEAGAHTHSLEIQWKKGLAQVYPMGPAETDWHRFVSGAQGSMGIISWASVKCEILPKIHKLFFIPAEKIEYLVDCAYRLLRLRLGDEFLILNNVSLAYLLEESAAGISALKEELPRWTILTGIAGRDILPEEGVKVQEEDIRGVAQQFGLQVLSTIPGARSAEVLDILLQTSREPYWKLGYRGGCQDIFFLTLLNKTPEFIRTMYSAAEALRYPTSEIGIYIQPQHQGVSHHCEFSLPYDPTDKTEALKVTNLFAKASDALMKEGAYFSRPYGLWADMVYNRDAQSRVLLEGLKNILDPNHILNPGKLCF